MGIPLTDCIPSTKKPLNEKQKKEYKLKKFLNELYNHLKEIMPQISKKDATKHQDIMRKVEKERNELYG